MTTPAHVTRAVAKRLSESPPQQPRLRPKKRVSNEAGIDHGSSRAVPRGKDVVLSSVPHPAGVRMPQAPVGITRAGGSGSETVKVRCLATRQHDETRGGATARAARAPALEAERTKRRDEAVARARHQPPSPTPMEIDGE
jgi:hypothetical protein